MKFFIAIQPVPTRAPKEFQLNIPKDTWEPIFFTAIDERAKLGKLKSLRSGALPEDDVEIRVRPGQLHRYLLPLSRRINLESLT
jgi:hypothetical protein